MSGRYTCNVCKLDGGWHYPDDGEPYRCPERAQTAERERIEGIVADQHTQAFQAAKRIVADFAETRVAFSANDCADAMDDAGVPSSLRGSAFSWAAREGLIEETATRVAHRDPAVRHKIPVWRSLAYGRSRRPA